MLGDDPETSSGPMSGIRASIDRLTSAAQRRLQKELDKTVPHVVPRWVALGVLFIVYCLRVFLWPGFYIVSYGLGIYLLNLLVDFLSPLDDPEMAGGSEAELPTRSDDEYRPFIRKLPEFSTWYRATKALSLGLVCTAMPFLDIPVFYPILLIYFVMLFVGTLRQRLQHMIKHRYLPFSWGKPKFSSNGGGDGKR